MITTSLFFALAIFLFGSMIGSFLNVVILRASKAQSYVRGRSSCPLCHHRLLARDLIPIVSFLVLRGKCRHCRKPIALQYPLVEVFTGLSFVASALWVTSRTPEITLITLLSVAVWWWTFATCIALFVTDVRFFKLPNAITYPAIVGAAALILSIAAITENGFIVVFLPRLFATLILGVAFMALFYVSKGRWIGGGDVKYIFFMSIVLGFPEAAVALAIACFSGAIAGAVILMTKKGTMRAKLKTKIPFGAFLTAGTIFALFTSAAIIEWFQRHF